MNIADIFAVAVVGYVFLAVFVLTKKGEFIFSSFDSWVDISYEESGDDELIRWIKWETRYNNRFFLLYLLLSLLTSAYFIMLPYGYLLAIFLYAFYLYRFWEWSRLEKRKKLA